MCTADSTQRGCQQRACEARWHGMRTADNGEKLREVCRRRVRLVPPCTVLVPHTPVPPYRALHTPIPAYNVSVPHTPLPDLQDASEGADGVVLKPPQASIPSYS
eukprot:3204633-Rhodomonas_salina.1